METKPKSQATKINELLKSSKVALSPAEIAERTGAKTARVLAHLKYLQTVKKLEFAVVEGKYRLKGGKSTPVQNDPA